MKTKNLLLSVLIGLSITLPASAITLKGTKYNRTEYVQDSSVRLVGAGVRVKYFFDVYSIGFYTESGECNKQKVIYSKEAKKVKIVLLRDIERKRFMGTIIEVFDQQIPAESPKLLKDQVKKFYELLFQGQEKVNKGDTYIFDYIPNKGLFLYENGKSVGVINSVSNVFMESFLSIWLGNETCCPETLKQIMSCEK